MKKRTTQDGCYSLLFESPPIGKAFHMFTYNMKTTAVHFGIAEVFALSTLVHQLAEIPVCNAGPCLLVDISDGTIYQYNSCGNITFCYPFIDEVIKKPVFSMILNLPTTEKSKKYKTLHYSAHLQPLPQHNLCMTLSYFDNHRWTIAATDSSLKYWNQPYFWSCDTYKNRISPHSAIPTSHCNKRHNQSKMKAQSLFCSCCNGIWTKKHRQDSLLPNGCGNSTYSWEYTFTITLKTNMVLLLISHRPQSVSYRNSAHLAYSCGSTSDVIHIAFAYSIATINLDDLNKQSEVHSLNVFGLLTWIMCAQLQAIALAAGWLAAELSMLFLDTCTHMTMKQKLHTCQASYFCTARAPFWRLTSLVICGQILLIMITGGVHSVNCSTQIMQHVLLLISVAMMGMLSVIEFCQCNAVHLVFGWLAPELVCLHLWTKATARFISVNYLQYSTRSALRTNYPGNCHNRSLVIGFDGGNALPWVCTTLTVMLAVLHFLQIKSFVYSSSVHVTCSCDNAHNTRKKINYLGNFHRSLVIGCDCGNVLSSPSSIRHYLILVLLTFLDTVITCTIVGQPHVVLIGQLLCLIFYEIILKLDTLHTHLTKWVVYTHLLCFMQNQCQRLKHYILTNLFPIWLALYYSHHICICLAVTSNYQLQRKGLDTLTIVLEVVTLQDLLEGKAGHLLSETVYINFERECSGFLLSVLSRFSAVTGKIIRWAVVPFCIMYITSCFHRRSPFVEFILSIICTYVYCLNRNCHAQMVVYKA